MALHGDGAGVECSCGHNHLAATLFGASFDSLVDSFLVLFSSSVDTCPILGDGEFLSTEFWFANALLDTLVLRVGPIVATHCEGQKH